MKKGLRSGLRSRIKAKRRCPASNNLSRPSGKHLVSFLVHLRISLGANSLGGEDFRLRKREGSFPTAGKVATMVDVFDAVLVS